MSIGGPDDAPNSDSPTIPDDGSDAGNAAAEKPDGGEGRALYTSEQQRILREALIAGTLPDCPACGGAMTRRPIGGGSFGLGYARRREWLLCAGCRRSAIFDVRRGTRT